ncbi:MAG: NAD-dependent epimerase/dehydratase family protein [Woeseia sp.]|jgi:2'-hydroxyisoflavone reductase|nr:NAD-dependent epimerase/dehydratase family protein [Woeseia sp.]MBT6210541.1 NAD-dependent epimerase/dehydratase family protein [Woeseia sp.]
MNNTRRRFIKSGLLGSAVVAAGCTTEVAVEEASNAEPWRSLRILILGGTGFIGPHMVKEALRRGHTVELFNRGRTDSELFPDLKLYVGDRNGGLDSLEGGDWDVVIDNSGYVPRHVEDSARLLASVVSHYVYISTISVYGDMSGPVDEDTAVGILEDENVEEVTGETYGPLKALCEQRVLQEVGADRTTILRPTYICGPGDRTDRFSYWPIRTMRGGEMLWPGTPADDIQIIDVRDLANFTVDSIEQKILGVFNTVTPKGVYKMGDLLADSLAVTAADVTPTWVATSFLNEHEVAAGGGLPIWEDPEGEGAPLMVVDGSRAAAAGLVNRPTRETTRDTIAWWRTLPAERTETVRSGLSAEREAEVLALWDSTQA